MLFQCLCCHARIALPLPYCQTCKQALRPAGLLCGFCLKPDCAGCTPEYPPVYSVYWAVGRAHQVLRTWKKHRTQRVDAQIFPRQFELDLPSDCEVTPVPQSSKRRLQLQGGSSWALARHVATILQRPLREHLGFQTLKSPQAQADQFVRRTRKNPFVSTRSITANVILVDDLLTTGQTLRHARAALEEKGARVILAMVLGIRPTWANLAATPRPQTMGQVCSPLE